MTQLEEELLAALETLAPMVDWLPHPDCVKAEETIRAAIAKAKEEHA